ncbi:MAG TPA: DUF1385 domain-containing protein, partial [Fimbriimonadaceae bacterium]|nr:DUF1385 domain-containing protein [Fimbriimonadaceae bacterium]
MPEESKKSYGGMAVVEGVMMRSPNHYSVACRAPNGKIVVHTEHIEKTWIGRQKWLMRPFLRGTFALLDTMGLGMRAMRIAGDVQMDPKMQPEEGEVVHPEKHKEEPPTKMQRFYERNQAAIDKAILGATLVLSLAIAFFVFNLLPNVVGQYVSSFLKSRGVAPEGNQHGFYTTVLVETIKLSMFIGYVALIRRYPAIYEVFRYHGAEHQAINAMEA